MFGELSMSCCLGNVDETEASCSPVPFDGEFIFRKDRLLLQEAFVYCGTYLLCCLEILLLLFGYCCGDVVF